jgi:osmotically-inducible protein OsmY
MLRALLRLVLIVVVLVGLGAFFIGYRWADGDTVEDRPVGTAGRTDEVSAERARQTGAEVGEKVAEGANKAQRAMADASLTTKIKAKMAQKKRALQLARETDGVTSVVDHLRVGGQ